MSFRKLGLLALVIGAAVIWALPAATLGQENGLNDATDALKDATGQAGSATQQTVQQTQANVRKAAGRTGATLDKTAQAIRSTTKTAAQKAAAERLAKKRATATDPTVQPPLHGTNDHGQGSTAVVDLNPSAERPLGGNPNGSDAGPEETVAGRSRGEKGADGKFHGHITILALLGSDVAGVDTNEGETKDGPLQPIQAGVLDPLCNGSANQVCLQLLRAHSETTAAGSSNDFAIARAQLGGPTGLGVGAAESQGNITQDPNCQTSTGQAKTANVTSGTGVVAAAANSSSTSTSCRGQAPRVTNTSEVVNLGGVGVPIPAAGCANGTPDTKTGLPPLAPVICNADEIAGAAGVRDALDVFVLDVGGTSLAKQSTAQTESVSTAPPETGGPACSDGVDNDGDGKIDAADPGCHSDNNANNPNSYNPNDTSEVDAAAPKNNNNNNGNKGTGENNRPECSDNRDNDGDGLADERDPGCHSDGNANNPDSYNKNDDSEANGNGGNLGNGGSGGNAGAGDARDLSSGSLPFTGTDVVGLALAGLMLLAGGMLLRRREDLLPRR